jgi:hypothetical protein
MAIAGGTSVPMSGALDAWRSEADSAADIAARVVGTAFVPDSLNVYDGNRLNRDASLAQVTAALLTGSELGLSPMAALRSIVVIKGTPTLVAVAARALVLRAGHELWLGESTKTRAIYYGQRAGSAHVQESVWTTDRAKDLGLLGKPNWRSQPAAMLVARATVECARLVAPEALLGLYADVELDEDAPPAVSAEEAPRPPRTRQRARAAIAPGRLPVDHPAMVDTPPLDDFGPQETVFGRPDQDDSDMADEREAPESTETAEPALPGTTTPDDDDPRDLRPLTDAQRRKILVQFGSATRDERLAGVAAIIGREVDTLNDLTRDEASDVIDRLGG